MHHLVITRFLLNQGKYKEQSFAKFDLFKTFCFPSIVNHNPTPYPVRWLLIVGRDLHVDIVEELFQMIEPYSDWIFVTFQDKKRLYTDNLPARLLWQIHRPYRYFITTRFDMDDAMHPDMFRRIQTWALENVVHALQNDPENPHRGIISFGSQAYTWHPEHYDIGVANHYHFPSSGAGMSVLLPSPFTPLRYNAYYHPHQIAEDFIRTGVLSQKKFASYPFRACENDRCFHDDQGDPMFIYVRTATADGKRVKHSPRKPLFSRKETAHVLKQFHVGVDAAKKTTQYQNYMAPRIEAEKPKGFKKRWDKSSENSNNDKSHKN